MLTGEDSTEDAYPEGNQLVTSDSPVATTAPFTPPAWLQRAVRQILQIVAPDLWVILTGLAAGHGALGPTVLALVTGVVFALLKYAARLVAEPGSQWWLVVLDRSGSAAAATVLGLGVTDLTGLVSVDYGRVVASAVIAAVTALVMYVYVPPVQPTTASIAGRPATGDVDPGVPPFGDTGSPGSSSRVYRVPVVLGALHARVQLRRRLRSAGRHSRRGARILQAA